MDKTEIATTCSELQALEKRRVRYMKFRIMISNRLTSQVAYELGYRVGLDEAKRKEAFADADRVIEQVTKEGIDTPMSELIISTMPAIDAFRREETNIQSAMTALAKQLPVAAWVKLPAQRGFGLPMLSQVIGETGDLYGYSNPAKVWKRLGCAPMTSNGYTLMPATWRGRKPEGATSPHAAEWAEFGYCPRRRSIAYLVGESLLKSNKDVYRRRYDEAKVTAFTKHPEWEWKPCTECKNDDDMKRGCPKCGGTGHKCGHAHNHGMLLSTKLLLKNLWLEWWGEEAPSVAWGFVPETAEV